jgi:inosine-uridine nucleoside N-ribohydrolase
MRRPSLAGATVAALALAAAVQAQPRPIPIIFDTDFGMVPQDDSFALMLALHSPELEILGVTTVAGNFSVEQATADALRVLEIAGRGDIPVYRGANMPLVHEKSEFATSNYGKWWSDDPPPPPPGGFARKAAEDETAYDFIVRTVMASPGEITIVALGPLTNVAIALGKEPGLASRIKELVIMGGAIASLEDGGGNITPNAEFNFWVDPEAARKTLRSGVPILLSPLNVSLIDRTLVVTEELYVDVDAHRGINYGVSVGGPELWPGAEGARKMSVQHDLDWPRFIEMFVSRVRAPLRKSPGG